MVVIISTDTTTHWFSARSFEMMEDLALVGAFNEEVIIDLEGIGTKIKPITIILESTTHFIRNINKTLKGIITISCLFDLNLE